MDTTVFRYSKSYIISVLIMIIGFTLNAEEDESDNSPVYTQYVAEITSAFDKEVYKKYGFECEASGGEMPYDVEEISVSLVVNGGATVELARELEVNLTERFVEIINAHEKIRPFLREYPFPFSRARVSISFRPSKKTFSLSSKNDVVHVFQARNKIYYQAENPSNPYVYKGIKDEPYEEARKIVQSNAAKNGTQQPESL